MPATSEPTRWVGRSGRVYVLDPDAPAREGGMASIRRVLPRSPANAVSTVPEGTLLALKIARADDRLAEEALGREVETFVALSRAPGSPPCPRLYDIVGTPATGLVMEWCPTDMERWWEASWSAPRAFVELCEALADISRRVREYEAVAELELGKRVIHADIKPRNVLRAADGRWLLTDFGAAKFRSVDDTQWAATRMILGTENFIAPEALFNARKPHPAAMDTWSLGCTFYALLKMRTLLASGSKMPVNGTHAHMFRTHRVALVGDLQQRKPALFVDKDLDPTQFTSPDRLPDKDRKAVAEALVGVFGKPSTTLEGVLATECLHLLDRALRIDPAKRFRDPLELAGEFEALALRYRELALRADGGFGSGRLAGGRGSRPTGESGELSRKGASAPSVRVAEDIVVDEGSGKRGTGSIPAAPVRTPPWIGVALLAVLGMQALQVCVSVAALVVALRAPTPAMAVAPVPTPPPVLAALVEPVAPAASLAAVIESNGNGGEAPGAQVADAGVVGAAPGAAASGDLAGTDPAGAASGPAVSSEPTGVVPKRLGIAPARGSATSGESGLLLVIGGQAYLIGPGGKMPVGSVAPGSYELYAQTTPEGEFVAQGRVQVSGGERIVYKCGLGTCRRMP